MIFHRHRSHIKPGTNKLIIIQKFICDTREIDKFLQPLAYNFIVTNVIDKPTEIINKTFEFHLIRHYFNQTNIHYI